MADDARSFRAFRRELNDKVRERARMRGTSPQDEMQQWVLQRIMVRMFDANPDDWMIKGGQTQLARWPDARSTSDVDMVATERLPAETMIERYESALARDYGDHLTFVPEYIGPMAEGTAARIKHIPFLGDEELPEIGTDVVPPRGRPLWRPAETTPFPEHIHPTGDPAERPDLRMISLTDTLAHKTAGMFTRTYGGDPPIRAQDLADVLFIAERTAWDGPETHAMLKEEFAFRRAQGNVFVVGDRFEIPNPEWHDSFRKYAASTPGLHYASLEEAVPAARAFLDPLLADQAPQADWNPQRGMWVPRDGAESREAAARALQGGFTGLDNPTRAVPGPPPSAAESGRRRPDSSRRPHRGGHTRPDPGHGYGRPHGPRPAGP